ACRTPELRASHSTTLRGYDFFCKLRFIRPAKAGLKSSLFNAYPLGLNFLSNISHAFRHGLNNSAPPALGRKYFAPCGDAAVSNPGRRLTRALPSWRLIRADRRLPLITRRPPIGQDRPLWS